MAELFHGQTFSFKDIGLQFVGQLLNYFLGKRNKKITVLVATSGDTGSAAIHACKGKQNIECFVLFPRGRITLTQEKQMTTVDEKNIHVIGVDNVTSDDLDDIIKSLFQDESFRTQYNLCSINSINWARISIQMVHYFYSYFRALELTNSPDLSNIIFSVPSGAFGNGLAGIIACYMGLPVEKIIIATNSNDILSKFFNTGIFGKGLQVFPTIAPAIDIQVPYNFERFLFYLLDGNTKLIKDLLQTFEKTGSLDLKPLLPQARHFVESASISTDQIKQTIKQIHLQYNYLVDPHTAVGIAAINQLPSLDQTIPIVCLATAHPAKFETAVQESIGSTFELPIPIKELDYLKTHCYLFNSNKELSIFYLRKLIIESYK